MSLLLCLETSTTVCSVALTENGKVVSFREVNEGFSHAEKLTVFISEVLEEAGKEVGHIDAIAVSSGPGSYTGLRIGVSVAKGLCLALDKPVIGITTLESMTAGAIKKINSPEKDVLFCPMIDAGRMEVYSALYDAKYNSHQLPVAVIVDENLFSEKIKDENIYFFGDGAEKCKSILSGNKNFIFYPEVLPSARFMAGIAFEKFSTKIFENLALFEPFYLKEYKPLIRK